MAIVLDNMNEFTFYLPGIGTQYFNGMTGPGYFMALNWFIYTVRTQAHLLLICLG